VRPLVAVRRAAPFDPDFMARHVLLQPLAGAARRLGPQGEFPDPRALARVFEDAAPVRFVPAVPRRRRVPLDERTQYDARIAHDRQVPTRSGCWHDLMNALVWGTFPGAKWALHGRQHRAIAARIAPGNTTRPPTRTRELDALALLDEGGVAIRAEDPPTLAAELKLGSGSLASWIERGRADAVVFGHAIYESLVLGVTPAVVAAIVLPRDGAGLLPLRAVDGLLRDAIEDAGRLRSPTELARVNLEEMAPRG
jgi:hypothetical protein